MEGKVEKNVLLALVSSLIEDAILQLKNDVPDSFRGPRGLRGPSGLDFSFEENKEHFESIIISFIESKLPELKLKLSDLTEEERLSLKGESFTLENATEIIKSGIEDIFSVYRDELKLKFSDLTEEELFLLKGKKGQAGKDGKDFSIDEHEEEITSIISGVVDSKRDDLKLKFSDLTEDELFLLKGKKGVAGQDGKDFSFEENEEKIVSVLDSVVESKKESFKLKFDDLTEDDKQSLRGKRGQRGKQGLQGENGLDGKDGKDFSFEENEEKIVIVLDNIVEPKKEDLKLKFDDLTEDDKQSLRGKRGQRGKQGAQGERGDDGKDFCFDEHEGKILNQIRDVVVEKKDDLKLTFADLSALEKRNLQGIKGKDGKDGKQGPPGKDGDDAPYVEEIKIDEGYNDFSLIFEFSDGTTLETNRIDLPKAKGGGSFGSGGGGGGGTGVSLGELEIYEKNVLVGKTTKLNFEDTLEVDQLDSTITVKNTEKKITVFDDAALVTSNLKSLTFEGNIEVVNRTTVGDWEFLSDVDTMSGYATGDTGKVVIRVLQQEEAERLTGQRICSETIPMWRLVTLVSKTHIALAQPNQTVEKATVYGISLAAGNFNDTIKVLYFGDATDISFNFNINQPFYLGVGGTMSAVPFNISPGFITRCGYGHGDETIMIDIDEPVGF